MLSNTGLSFARQIATELVHLGLGELVQDAKQEFFVINQNILQEKRDSLLIDEKVISIVVKSIMIEIKLKC